MMLRIYDADHNFLGKVENSRNVYTEEELMTGLRALCLQAPCLPEYFNLFQEENYIETKDYNYVIKEVNYKGNSFFEVRAAADIEDIKSANFNFFDCFDKLLEDAYEYCLRATPWVVNYHSERQFVTTYQLPNVNALDMIYYIAEDYQQELWFDTKNQVLHVYDKMGSSLGGYYSNEIRLHELKRQSSTYDFATVLVPIGKNGLTIRDINNGKDFLENFSYSNKVVEAFWINEEYDIAEKLMAAAEIELEKRAQPQASYSLKVSDIGPSVALGDEIMLIDRLKKIKVKQRVVKIIRYPNMPEEDMLELSNLQEDFARNFVKQQKRIDKEIAYLKQVIANLA